METQQQLFSSQTKSDAKPDHCCLFHELKTK